MELYDIVMKINGPVLAIGESNADAKRLDNLKTLTALVDQLLIAIGDASSTASDHRASMKAIGACARDYLREVATRAGDGRE